VANQIWPSGGHDYPLPFIFNLLGVSMKIRLVVAGLVLALSASATLAQSAELKLAHKAAVAAQACDLNLDSAKSSQLGDAVLRLEQKSGLAQSELDTLFAEAQAAADADKAAFCADAAKAVDSVLAATK
jgi:hypothetical protein